jgi:putative transposase
MLENIAIDCLHGEDAKHCVSTDENKNKMSEKYQNKYRIKSTRHPLWDYGNSAAYFITICTKNREHYFGRVIDGIFEYTTIGNIVKEQWEVTPDIRLDMNLTLGAFVVMPNHFHGIIMIGGNKYNGDDDDGGGNDDDDEGDDDGGGGDVGDGDDDGGEDAKHCVSTAAEIRNQFGTQSKNLASIIRGFKSAVTKNARLIDGNFGWQNSYHDHIIRNEKSLQRISNYIINNPELWKEDKFFNK